MSSGRLIKGKFNTVIVSLWHCILAIDEIECVIWKHRYLLIECPHNNSKANSAKPIPVLQDRQLRMPGRLAPHLIHEYILEKWTDSIIFFTSKSPSPSYAFLKQICLFIHLFDRQDTRETGRNRERWRRGKREGEAAKKDKEGESQMAQKQKSSMCLLPIYLQQPSTPGQCQEPGTPFRHSTWGAGTQAHGTYLLFPRVAINRKLVQKWRSWDLHPKQLFNPLHPQRLTRERCFGWGLWRYPGVCTCSVPTPNCQRSSNFMSNRITEVSPVYIILWHNEQPRMDMFLVENPSLSLLGRQAR